VLIRDISAFRAMLAMVKRKSAVKFQSNHGFSLKAGCSTFQCRFKWTSIY